MTLTLKYRGKGVTSLWNGNYSVKMVRQMPELHLNRRPQVSVGETRGARQPYRKVKPVADFSPPTLEPTCRELVAQTTLKTNLIHLRV